MAAQTSEVDRYIDTFPPGIREMLTDLRKIIRQSAPQAEEVMSYGMPAYKLNGILVWFGGHTRHVGFYPKAGAIVHFSEELTGYKCSKGAVQFPAGQTIPAALVEKIIRYRIGENESKQKVRRDRKLPG